MQRGVPVVIYSVPHHGETLPDLRDLPWIEKPVEGEDLLRALVRLVPLRPAGDRSWSPTSATGWSRPAQTSSAASAKGRVRTDRPLSSVTSRVQSSQSGMA